MKTAFIVEVGDEFVRVRGTDFDPEEGILGDWATFVEEGETLHGWTFEELKEHGPGQIEIREQ